jgi:hypothetical protein
VQDVERKWLAYVRGVLEGDLLSECCASTAADQPAPVRRWPGYLGSRYESSRVLLVGAIHNADQLFTPEILALCDEARRPSWKEQWLSIG